MFKYIKRAASELVTIVTSDEVITAVSNATIGALAGVVVGAFAIFIGGAWWWIFDIIASILLGAGIMLIVIPWLESLGCDKLTAIVSHV